MFGKMGDMMGMLSQLKEAQKNIEKVKQDLDNEYLSKNSDDEGILVTVSLSGMVSDIQIKKEYESQTEMLNVLKTTLNTALNQARTEYEKRLSENAMEGMPDISKLMGK